MRRQIEREGGRGEMERKAGREGERRGAQPSQSISSRELCASDDRRDLNTNSHTDAWTHATDACHSLLHARAENPPRFKKSKKIQDEKQKMRS